MIDDGDFGRLSTPKWCARKTGKRNTFYAMRSCSPKTILMHREIMGAGQGEQVDHANHNPLDNRKANLRFVNHSQNRQNSISETGTSRYKGTCWYRARRKWKAAIQKDGIVIHLGLFCNEKEAAYYYDEAARILFGEYALLNFPNVANSSIIDNVRCIIARKQLKERAKCVK